MLTHRAGLRSRLHRGAPTCLLVVALISSGACGARTAPELPREEDAPVDAGHVGDAGGASDAGRHDASVGRDAAACEPGPLGEVCNGEDDDCDGRVDERLPLTALGETVVLREADELSAGGCAFCASARFPTLVPRPGGGFHAVFFVTTDLRVPQRNVFVRELDPHGRPVSASRLMEVGSAHSVWPTSAYTGGAGAPRFAICRNPPTFSTELLSVTADGGASTVELGEGCLRSMAVVGDRIFTRPDGAREPAVLLSWRLDGSEPRRLTLPNSISRAPIVAASASGVGVLLEEIERRRGGEVLATRVSFAGLDSDAQLTREPRRIALPGEEIWNARLVGTAEGWMLVIPSRGGPARRGTLSPDGQLIGELTSFDDEHTLGPNQVDWTFVGGLTGASIVHVFAWQGSMHVQRLDPRGGLLQAFEEPVSDGVGSPNVRLTDDGRILVTWHGGSSARNSGNPLYLREFGCGG